MTALIQIENLIFRPASLLPEKPDILRGIDLVIEKGTFVAIIGKNGSGKTTLIKHINGLLLPTRGRVVVDGLDTRQPELRPRIQSTVGMVFQNPADQIVASTVEEDIAFGLENLNLPTSEIRSRVTAQISAVGLTAEAIRPPHLLSGGQIQMVALAGVLARQPRVILFDEPTSMLDAQTRETFIARLCQLHQQGMTIIYITHHMEETVYADKIVVMHAGQIVNQGTPVEIFWGDINLHELELEKPESVQLAKNFQSLGWHFDGPILTPSDLIKMLPTYSHNGRKKPVESVSNNHLDQEPLIDLQDIHYTYLAGSPLAQKALNGADLQVSSGRIHAIAGTNGSGKSTLLQHINGILRPDQGSVHVAGLILEDPKISLREVVRRVGLVFQSPEAQFFEVFVGDEIAYGPKQFEMDSLRERVRQAMEWVGLDFDALKDRRLETLSGGEKRKVALASTLVLDQEILLFDEPSAGMDPRARQELAQLFEQLSNQGKTLLIASHRMEELAAIAQDLSLMHGGEVVRSDSCKTVMADISAISQVGLIPPLATQIASALIEKGWPIDPKQTTTPDRLFSVIKGIIQ